MEERAVRQLLLSCALRARVVGCRNYVGSYCRSDGSCCSLDLGIDATPGRGLSRKVVAIVRDVLDVAPLDVFRGEQRFASGVKALVDSRFARACRAGRPGVPSLASDAPVALDSRSSKLDIGRKEYRIGGSSRGAAGVHRRSSSLGQSRRARAKLIDDHGCVASGPGRRTRRREECDASGHCGTLTFGSRVLIEDSVFAEGSLRLRPVCG